MKNKAHKFADVVKYIGPVTSPEDLEAARNETYKVATTPFGFNPKNHIAVICARRGIDLTHFGRNEPCPCDSGKKFKKCCINQDPVNLCYRFAHTDATFHAANLAGETEKATGIAQRHNELLSVLKLLDPSTFKDFEPLKAI